MQRPVHPSFGWVKNEGAKNFNKGFSKTIDIVSYASNVRINGVTCVFEVHFRSSDTFRVCLTGLTEL